MCWQLTNKLLSLALKDVNYILQFKDVDIVFMMTDDLYMMFGYGRYLGKDT